MKPEVVLPLDGVRWTPVGDEHESVVFLAESVVKDVAENLAHALIPRKNPSPALTRREELEAAGLCVGFQHAADWAAGRPNQFDAYRIDHWLHLRTDKASLRERNGA